MNPEERKQLADLVAWKKARETQQLTLPLDPKSLAILSEQFMRIISTVRTEGGVAQNIFTTYIGQQGNIEFEVYPVSLVSYTVDISTNYLRTSGYTKFWDDQPVVVDTDEGGVPPSPLSELATYYVRDSLDGHEFKLAATVGGAAINITDIGSGRQFIAMTF